MRTAADRLVQGNIILTERTDPGWITLFPQASGLIVERGSMLSHSFVVARELNLPAVVGVENATTVIPDGALVTLDGLKGEITVEDKGIL
jgi:pyruvate,water dikinase